MHGAVLHFSRNDAHDALVLEHVSATCPASDRGCHSISRPLSVPLQGDAAPRALTFTSRWAAVAGVGTGVAADVSNVACVYRAMVRVS